MSSCKMRLVHSVPFCRRSVFSFACAMTSWKTAFVSNDASDTDSWCAPFTAPIICASCCKRTPALLPRQALYCYSSHQCVCCAHTCVYVCVLFSFVHLKGSKSHSAAEVHSRNVGSTSACGHHCHRGMLVRSKHRLLRCVAAPTPANKLQKFEIDICLYCT